MKRKRYWLICFVIWQVQLLAQLYYRFPIAWGNNNRRLTKHRFLKKAGQKEHEYNDQKLNKSVPHLLCHLSYKLSHK